MGIRLYTILITAAFLACATLALSFIAFRSLRTLLVNESRNRVRLAIGMIEGMTAWPLDQNDKQALEIIVDRAAREGPQRVIVANRNGIIIADSDNSSIGSTNAVIDRVLRTKRTVIIRTEGKWEAANPVFSPSGEFIGVDYVDISTRALDEALDRAIIQISAFSMIAIILGTGLAFFLAHHLGNSLTPILKAIGRTAAGDTESSIYRTGIAEIDEIGRAFIGMSRLVEKRVRDLESLNNLAEKLSSSYSINEFVTSIKAACSSLLNADCTLLMGDPRRGILTVPGEEPAVRRVTVEYAAHIAVREQRALSIGIGNEFPPRQQVAEGFLPESAVIAPLITSEGNVPGLLAVTFDPAEMASPTKEDEITVEAIATLAAPRLEYLQQAGANQRAVEALRNILTPEFPPTVPGVEVFATFKAAEGFGFSGDFYDILKLDDNNWGFILGDISGKGLEAGRYTAMTKYVIRSYLLEYNSVATALSQTNAAIAAQIEEFMFITLSVITLNIRTHNMIYGSAGHFPILRYRPEKDQFDELFADDGVLGIDQSAGFGEHLDILGPGELLTVYTDGVVEARRSGELYGIKRLQDAIRANKDKSLNDIAQAIVDDVMDFTDNQLQDDLTFVLIRLK